jgi:hypothetical protein
MQLGLVIEQKLPPGTLFCDNRFEVVSFLGAGAFGAVLHCKDRTRLGSSVAVKLMFKG